MPDSVLIVEDHALMSVGLKALLGAGRVPLDLAGTAATPQDALAFFAQGKERGFPRIVLLDLSLEERLDGFDLLEEILRRSPDTEIVVYTAHEEIGIAERATRAGAIGVVSKSEKSIDVIKALAAALKGRSYVSPRFMRGGELLPSLSVRQREVLTLISEGLSNDEVAERLGVSAETVKTHVGALLDKLGASDRTAAVAFGIRNALID